MTFCTRCGNQIEEGAVCECSAKATPIINKEAAKGHIESAGKLLGIDTSKDTYERGQNIIPDNIRACEGEIPIKQYKIANFRTLIFFLLPPFVLPFMRAEGRMQVTNKRVVFRAPGRDIFGGKTTLQHEFAINEVAGIEAGIDYMFRLQYLIIGLITLGLVPLILAKVKTWLKLAAVGGAILVAVLAEEANEGIVLFFMALIAIAVLAIFCFCFLRFCYRENLVIRIKNKTGLDASPIDISIKGTFFMEVMPTDGTNRAIREIGAMINDIQTLGDLGLQKWLDKK